MATRNWLYKKAVNINNDISIVIPTVGEVLDDEDNYYDIVSMVTAMPIDYMVLLADMGIDFDTINEYELFLLLFQILKERDTSLVFGELDLNGFYVAENSSNNTVVLMNKDTGVMIDRLVHAKMADTLRGIHHIEKNVKKPGNKEAKDYMIERARKKMKRKKRNDSVSDLEIQIVALVNTEQFHYGYDSVRDLSIYQFNESVRQIIKKIDYDNRMRGVYAGTLDAKKLSQDDLNWLIHK